MEQKKKQDHKFYGGFRYAIEGILTGIRQEQNMKMHCIMTVLVVLAGFFFEISKIEWYLSAFVRTDHGTGTGEYIC